MKCRTSPSCVGRQGRQTNDNYNKRETMPLKLIQPGAQHMSDVPAIIKEQFNRLLVLLHQQAPHCRPSADQARQVVALDT